MEYPNRPPPPPPHEMGSKNTLFNTELRLDLSYFRTPSGIIKSIVIVFSLIGLICIQGSVFRSHGPGIYFTIVTLFSFWYCSALLCIYLFHVAEKYYMVRWLQLEILFCIIMIVLYLTGSTVVVAFGAMPFSVAGFFGYLCMVLYGFDAYLKYRALKAGELAQGTRVVTKQPHIVTPPALP